jgi:NAD(P)-dependent dehydrogenase (short-subunit alcohol dehydrogenase family)
MALNKKIRIFDGATAIVTGGASGIGRGLAEELAKRGCEVVLADRQIELAEEVASKICDSGGKAKAVKVDVTDRYFT